MDVVALAQMGFPQAVATLGTACTTTHVQKLLRQTDNVIFSFDGDKAGRRAARRALEACLPHVSDDKTIKFLFLPAEHDPDSYIREYGTPAFEQQVQEAMPLSQFLLREAQGEHDLSSPEGRARVQFDAKPMLQAMPPTALRLQIVRGLATMTHSTPGEVEGLFELAKPVAAARIAPPRSRREQPVGLELKLIRVVICHPALALMLDSYAQAAFNQFGAEAAERLVQLTQLAQSLGEQGTFAVLAQQLKELGAEYDAIIGELAAAPEPEIEAERLWLAATVRQLKGDALKRELDQLFSAGLSSEEIGVRYREITAKQDQLRREAEADLGNR
jgi:DNA primase